jgi:cytochrome b561
VGRLTSLTAKEVEEALTFVRLIAWLASAGRSYLHTVLWTALHYLAFAFFALVMMHLAAGLFHGLLRRDGVLQTMLPGK